MLKDCLEEWLLKEDQMPFIQAVLIQVPFHFKFIPSFSKLTTQIS